MSNHPDTATDYAISPMTLKDAVQIMTFLYPPPYDLYNMGTDKETLADLTSGLYYAVHDMKGVLAGFFCYGMPAQVPAGYPLHAYDDAGFLDIGLGMDPSLCDRGLGLGFLKSGLAFAREALLAKSIRLTVADFNHRAIRVYEKAGFVKTFSFRRTIQTGSLNFTVMTLQR